MNEFCHDATSELKRCDHLISVSLKYTRTVDVFISILKRFISCIDYAICGLLEKAKEDGLVQERAPAPVGRVNQLREIYKDDSLIIDLFDDYLMFRKLVLAKYTKRKEFRRYVTMTVTNDDGSIIEVDIDKIEEYFDRVKNFINHVKEILE